MANKNASRKPAPEANRVWGAKSAEPSSFVEAMKNAPEFGSQEPAAHAEESVKTPDFASFNDLSLTERDDLTEDTFEASGLTFETSASPESDTSPEEKEAAVESLIDEFNSETGAAVDKIDALNEDIDRKIDNLRASLAAKEEERDTLETNAKELADKLAPTDNEIAELSANAEPKWTDYFNAIGSAAIALAKEKFKKPKDRDLTKIHTDLTNLFNGWKQNKDKIAELENNSMNDRENLAETEEKLDEVDAEIADLRDQIADLEAKKEFNLENREFLDQEFQSEKQEFAVRKEREAAEKELEGDGGIEGYRSRIERETAELDAKRDEEIAGIKQYVEEENARIRNAKRFAGRFGRSVEGELISDDALDSEISKIKADYDEKIAALSKDQKRYDRIFSPETRKSKIKSLFEKLNFVKAHRDLKREHKKNALAWYYSNQELSSAER